MASISVFVSSFRSSIAATAASFNTTKELVAFATTLGWTESDYDTVLAGSDISGAEFVAALASAGTLATTFATQAQALAKMRP